MRSIFMAGLVGLRRPAACHDAARLASPTAPAECCGRDFSRSLRTSLAEEDCFVPVASIPFVAAYQRRARHGDHCWHRRFDGGHFMRKCSLDGKVLLELGIPGKPAPYMSGEPFHRCTHTALSPKGEIYVSDGYGNARVHKYSPDGKLLMSWGGPGTNPGEFNIVHNICTDADGWVYVADRENHRIQVFDGNGKYETQWNNLHRPCGLYMDYTRHPVCYIGELGPVQPVNRNSPNLGPRVSIVDNQGKLLSRFGDLHAGTAPTAFLGPHGLTADSRGDLYVGEVSWTQWPQFYPDTPRPAYIRSLQKYERVR
jgi:NHL repeat-containing protein